MSAVNFTAQAGPVLAVLTKQAIDDALEADQGDLFRALLRETLPMVEDIYQQKGDEAFRSHLGASLVGRDCLRELWYTFHWASRQHSEARMIRLFNRGHIEEARMIALLRMIGCEVWTHDEDGKQFRIGYHGGHFGGSIDGVARGIPDDPHRPLLLEFKTHNDNSFSKLQSAGVAGAKPEHYAQTQTYMAGMGLPRTLYMGVNKNDDDLYLELIDADPAYADVKIDKGLKIIQTQEPPTRIHESPGWYQCKFCDHIGVCKLGRQLAINCRTCEYSVPGSDGIWYCTNAVNCGAYGDIIPLDKKTQLAACERHSPRPA